MNRFFRGALGGCVLVVLGGASRCPAQCVPDWSDRFSATALKGGGGLVEFDDGSGSALYVGPVDSLGRGSGGYAGLAAYGVARWNGRCWEPAGFGLSTGGGLFTAFDAGSGPELYAAGTFIVAGGGTVSGIGKWDGASWSSVGGAVASSSGGVFIRSMAVFDDGSGPALYVGGMFTQVGSVTTRDLAKWNGSEWTAMDKPNGVPNFVTGMIVRGTGPSARLVVVFGMAMRQWDGQAWSSLGNGWSFGSSISSLAVLDSGFGPDLYAGGIFDQLFDVPIRSLGRWNGAAWSPVGGLTSADWVKCLHVTDDGTGPALYVGGTFAAIGGVAAQNVARFDGSAFQIMSGGAAPAANPTIGDFDDGSGRRIIMNSPTGYPNETQCQEWTGSDWQAMGGGLEPIIPTPSVPAGTAIAYDDGSGSALYVGHWFSTAAGRPASNIARWSPSEGWSPLGSGVNQAVKAMAAYDDGMGRSLFVGGLFTVAGGNPANYVARWNSGGWSAVGTGPSAAANVLLPYNDGTGLRLYAGCNSGGAVSRWDGSIWTKVGTLSGSVVALAPYNDGVGMKLYAGGTFSGYLRAWDGSVWSSVGGFAQSAVNCLAVFDDGFGPALFVGGTFQNAAGVPARGIARWNGTSWSAVGDGLSSGTLSGAATSLLVHDDGSGPALYVIGPFDKAGQVPAAGIARWDGKNWSALGSGFDLPGSGTLAEFDDGAGPALFAVGNMSGAGGKSSIGIAAWTRTASWPWVSRQPKDSVVLSGRKAVLTARARGQSPFTFQWRKNGIPLADGGNVSGTATSDLVFDPVTRADAGVYDVLVGNACKEVTSRGATLAVFCDADYNRDGVVDGTDYNLFSNDFESWDPAQQIRADYNGDGFVDGLDYDQFMNAFEAGC